MHQQTFALVLATESNIQRLHTGCTFCQQICARAKADSVMQLNLKVTSPYTVSYQEKLELVHLHFLAMSVLQRKIKECYLSKN